MRHEDRRALREATTCEPAVCRAPFLSPLFVTQQVFVSKRRTVRSDAVEMRRRFGLGAGLSGSVTDLSLELVKETGGGCETGESAQCIQHCVCVWGAELPVNSEL